MGPLWALGETVPLIAFVTCFLFCGAADDADNISEACYISPNASPFAGGNDGPAPWWGTGLRNSNSLADRSLMTTLSAIADGDAAALGTSGPKLWGTGLDFGPASIGDSSSFAYQWRTGVSPESARFESLGDAGPPTDHTRRISAAMSEAFACRTCQHLVGQMWEELAEPSLPEIINWLEVGCVANVRRTQISRGWRLTTSGCEGAGAQILSRNTIGGGQTWCLLQDPLDEVIRKPKLSQEYDPAKDALFLGCQRTIAVRAREIAKFLVAQRNGTRAKARNEKLFRLACTRGACCGMPYSSLILVGRQRENNFTDSAPL